MVKQFLQTALEFPLLSVEIGKYNGLPTLSGFVILQAPPDIAAKNIVGTIDRLTQARNEVFPDLKGGLNFRYGSFDSKKGFFTVRFDAAEGGSRDEYRILSMITAIAHKAGLGPDPEHAQWQVVKSGNVTTVARD